MAFTYGFYNSVNHDRKYDAVQMGQIFDGIITDGIYATYLKAMVVKASSNASEVIVQPGRAWFNHTWSYNDADFPVAAPEPEVVLDRIDTLVLDINAEDASRTNSYLWVQGTPTSQVPEPPALIHTVTHNQYPLCDVYRKAGTTQIYAADITNRVGTSDCPFVTGVLEGINIDDLLAQWDDEFHTWENATKASFEGWMVNQQAVYTAWWDALKAQMAGDVADVEAWIETIHDILDEEVATRLQAEIDEIKTELPSGSHITVTTSDTELYSRTVTITDEANHTVTSQFDATGVAVFKTVPYVGNLTISSTDGTRTATSVVQTPYFARYSFSIAFWSATVNIDGTSELGGETVTIEDSSEALVGTVVLNASGLGVFNATYPDTYKFSVTHGGETMSVTLEVSQETTYNVEIHGSFNWQGWVDLSENYSSSDFDDLDELLADQKAVRELMTIHACVDYLASATRADANITQIINDDICAKWINNRDYALDTLYANSAIAAVMDTADKYFYGEWALMPQVPIMTSNTTPSGVASSKDTYEASFAAFHAFDGETGYSNRYIPADGTDTKWIQYMFTHPICVKEVFIALSDTLSAVKERVNRLEVIGSNDGVSWSSPLGSISTDDITDASNIKIYLANNTQYTYYRVNEYKKISSGIGYYTIQFYAWTPKGNVPVMTSANAPYGTVISEGDMSDNEAYKAFDDNPSTRWTSSAYSLSTNYTLAYKFINPVLAKRAYVWLGSSQPEAVTNKFKIQGSNTGDSNDWHDVSDEITRSKPVTTSANNWFDPVMVELNSDSYYLYYRIYRTYTDEDMRFSVIALQFYGRQLSVSVPVMTSNTAPYGEVIKSSERVDGGPNYAWYAFDKGSGSNWWLPNSTVPAWIGYKNNTPTCVKMFTITNATYSYARRSIAHGKLQGSNDGTNWVDIVNDFGAPSDDSGLTYAIQCNENITAYKYHRIYVTAVATGDDNRPYIAELQFYGLDYSEREFEPGTTKKWLYDHGVELEDLTIYTSSGTVEKRADDIYLKGNSSKTAEVRTTSSKDLSSYDVLRAKIFNVVTSATLAVVSTPPVNYGIGTNITAVKQYTTPMSESPYNLALDVSSINQSAYPTVYAENNGSVELTELWAE